MSAAIAALLLVVTAIPQAAAAPLPHPKGPPVSAVAVPLPHPKGPPVSAVAAAVSVDLDQTSTSVRIGQRFSFTSTVRNDGDRPLPGVIAHLNVLSLDPDVYVDPEDWSSRRTSYLGELPAHASARLAWTVQAVNSGRFVIYVAVSEQQGAGGVTASNALGLAVAEQRTLDAGGVLPLAVAVPATVLLLIGFAARRRRRGRRAVHPTAQHVP